MAAFTDPYDTTKPLGAQAANTLDNIIRTLKSAIEQRQALEHYSYETGTDETTSATAMGRHIAGAVGCFGYGTITERNALGVVGVGSLWEATDLHDGNPPGTLYRYTAGGWVTSQLATGIIFASQAEADAGLVTDKAISPSVLQKYYPNVAQTVVTDDTQTWASSVSWVVITGLSVAITPRFSDSTIRVMANLGFGSNSPNGLAIRILRDGSPVGVSDSVSGYPAGAASGVANSTATQMVAQDFIDSPATTSEVVYTVEARMPATGATTRINRSFNNYARVVSTITVEEIPVLT